MNTFEISRNDIPIKMFEPSDTMQYRKNETNFDARKSLKAELSIIVGRVQDNLTQIGNGFRQNMIGASLQGNVFFGKGQSNESNHNGIYKTYDDTGRQFSSHNLNPKTDDRFLYTADPPKDTQGVESSLQNIYKTMDIQSIDLGGVDRGAAGPEDSNLNPSSVLKARQNYISVHQTSPKMHNSQYAASNLSGSLPKDPPRENLNQIEVNTIKK
jgi:hypothetical protein